MTPSLRTLVLLGLALPLHGYAKEKSAVDALSQQIPPLMQQADIPGISIALVEKGRTAWVHSFGTVDPSTGEPVTEHTRFSAASLSKTVFAYAVLKLVDEGKLDLDTPLTHYWPERVVEPQDDPRLDKITARIVLSQRTGFRNWRNNDKLRIYFEPGERFSYSGEGFVYLQHTIEHIEGKPLNAIMQALVFDPLGMKDSTYISGPAPNTTFGFRQGLAKQPPIESDKGNAAASLQTTAHDYALFLEAVLNGRGLKLATLRQMETPQIAVDPTCTNCTDHAPVRLSTEVFWGLGWGIEKTTSGMYLWHWGDNGAFKAFVAADIKRRNAVVFFANSTNGLAIAPPIVHTAIGGDHPAFAWINYDRYDSANVRFLHDVVHSGAQALDLHQDELTKHAVAEGALETAGYILLFDQKKTDEAIAVFLRNTQLYPNSADAHASLGEAYMTAGKTELAIASYERALTFKPDSVKVKETLAKLRSEAPRETTH